MDISHLSYPVEFIWVVNSSADQRICPFHIRNNYLELKMWTLLVEMQKCNSKGICFETSNEGRNHQSRALLDC